MKILYWVFIIIDVYVCVFDIKKIIKLKNFIFFWGGLIYWKLK